MACMQTLIPLTLDLTDALFLPLFLSLLILWLPFDLFKDQIIQILPFLKQFAKK